MRSVTRSALLVGVVAVAAFAVGGQLAVRAQEGGDSGSAVQPLCELVTRAEAEAALGHEVVVSDTGRACTYTVVAPGAFASLSVMRGPEGVSAETFADAMAQYAGAANAELERVPDTGDEAWATVSDPASQVIARAGERFVTVIFVAVDTPPAERVAAMAELARTALTRTG